MSLIDKQAIRWQVIQSERGLDDAEQAAFEAWLGEDIRHQGAYARATVINNALAQAASQAALFPGAGPLPADADTQLEPEAAPIPAPARRARWPYAALAAGLLVLVGVGVGVVPMFDHTTLTTAKGEFRRIPLSDRSVANINSGSKLEVKLTGSKRQVKLDEGEAWFEVAKNKEKPFVVEAGQAHVQAVGTAFGVRRYHGGAEVLVTEGSVEVWSGNQSSQKRVLLAGDQAFVPFKAAPISVTRQPQEIWRKLAWREGKLIFAKQTLNDAVADFNRYSSKRIVIADPVLGNKKIVGQYQIDAAEQFAMDVSVYLDVPIQITTDEIIIGQQRWNKSNSNRYRRQS